MTGIVNMWNCEGIMQPQKRLTSWIKIYGTAL